MSQILLYLSLALVVLWTARLARSKGQNHFFWGGGSAVLMVVPDLLGFSNSQLLGMIPLVVLLFLKNRRATEDSNAEQVVSCGRCQTQHMPGHNYCVNCGWELEKPYTDDQAVAEQPSNTTSPATERPQVATAAVDEIKVQPEPTVVAAEQTTVPPEPPIVEEVPDPIPAEPVVVRPPTAERLTERGISLINDGRIQEAIDQFTKALALDPQYRSAWSRRAEAYDKMGRNREAAADLRRLEAIQEH